jgi:hypothetical protein
MVVADPPNAGRSRDRRPRRTTPPRRRRTAARQECRGRRDRGRARPLDCVIVAGPPRPMTKSPGCMVMRSPARNERRLAAAVRGCDLARHDEMNASMERGRDLRLASLCRGRRLQRRLLFQQGLPVDLPGASEVWRTPAIWPSRKAAPGLPRELVTPRIPSTRATIQRRAFEDTAQGSVAAVRATTARSGSSLRLERYRLWLRR